MRGSEEGGGGAVRAGRLCETGMSKPLVLVGVLFIGGHFMYMYVHVHISIHLHVHKYVPVCL